METRKLNWKKSAVIYVIGYVIAVVTSVSVVVGLITIPTILPDDGAYGSIYRQMDVLGAMFLVGLVYTGISALPGYVVTLILTHHLKKHGKWIYIPAGILTAILAHLLLEFFTRSIIDPEMFVFTASLPGGAVGAYAYFLWRQKMLSVWTNQTG